MHYSYNCGFVQDTNMAERSSGNVWQQENVPSLVPLSDDEENEVIFM